MGSAVDERYADALVRVAFRNRLVVEYAGNLEKICELFDKVPKLEKLLSNPRIAIDIKADILDDILKKEIENEHFLNFIKILIENKRIMSIKGILKEYLVAAKQYYEILTITIETPIDLSKQQIEDIKEKCRVRFGVKKVRESVVLNKSLIGGTRVIAGNVVIDNSLKKQLRDIEKLMNE